VKAVILAGGYGTRISEESALRPKPMVEIGDRPLLWHIMKIYSAHGIDDFVICCGYKGWMIKDFFASYVQRFSDLTFDFREDLVETHTQAIEPWRVTLVDTGEQTMTGGRLKRVRPYLGDDTFCFTYGDAVSDIDISALIEFHHEFGALATLTAVQPPGRFGTLLLHEETPVVANFREKPHGDGAWINGGFFVLEPTAIDYIDGDHTIWEREPMERLAQEGNLAAFRHRGYWQNMDTLRDKIVLEQEWQGSAPAWKVWEGTRAAHASGFS